MAQNTSSIFKVGAAYLASKEVISRRNQDGTVILMKLDENTFFYKIDGLAAQVWSDFVDTTWTLEELLDRYSVAYPGYVEQISTGLTEVLQLLVQFQLLLEASGTRPEVPPIPITEHILFPDGVFRMGEVREFNLEQIETEVLNESIYLDVFAGSDLRLKTALAPIQGALNKVTRLEGVHYRWDQDRVSGSPKHRGLRSGLIAQQVAEQMPELVRTDEKTGLLAVEYSKLNSYLVEAIKELNQLVVGQAEQIKKLELKLNS